VPFQRNSARYLRLNNTIDNTVVVFKFASEYYFFWRAIDLLIRVVLLVRTVRVVSGVNQYGTDPENFLLLFLVEGKNQAMRFYVQYTTYPSYDTTSTIQGTDTVQKTSCTLRPKSYTNRCSQKKDRHSLGLAVVFDLGLLSFVFLKNC
jgi:hypothetical protein